MSIDFSKAPEGATHYGESNGKFYRDGGSRVEVWSLASNRWFPSRCFRSLDGLAVIPAFEPFVSVEDAPIGSKHDQVNSPSHYASGGVECIDAIKGSMSREAFLGYLKGNVQKYMWRYEKKVNPAEDLKKARWYLERLIAEQE